MTAILPGSEYRLLLQCSPLLSVQGTPPCNHCACEWTTHRRYSKSVIKDITWFTDWVSMSGPYMSNSTSLRHTPESITVWILSLGPSDRYESAQQASARTSGSLLKSNMESTLRHGDTCEETTAVRSCYKGKKTLVYTKRVCLCASLKFDNHAIGMWFTQNWFANSPLRSPVVDFSLCTSWIAPTRRFVW